MTDQQTPPDWALIEAAKRADWRGELPTLKQYYNNLVFRALCDMIAKHEQPPVDRKVMCVEQAMYDFGWDKTWLGKSACLRAIELWQEGFGK